MAKRKKKDEYDFSDDVGMGFEDVRPDDLSTPFLMIIQSNSPEVTEGKEKYMEDAKPGMIINTATREILGGRGDPVTFIPCKYHKSYVEWTPRDKGGGFVKTHENVSILSECTRGDTGKDELSNGNVIVTTAYIFGLLIDDDNPIKAVIGLSSTQLKKARLWLSMMMSIKMEKPDGEKFTPPMFSHKYHLSSIPESNDKGDWFGWKIDNAGVIDSKLVAEAKETAKLASADMQRKLPAASESEDDTPF